MSFKIDVSIETTGDNFSPSKWEADVNIVCHQKNEKGEPFWIGPRKGQPKPFGSGSYVLDENAWKEFFTGDIPEFWRRLKEIVQSADKFGATDMHFLVLVAYPDQCNLSFEVNALKFIADLGLRVDFTAYMND